MMSFPRSALAALSALTVITGALGSNACIQVTSWDEFTDALESLRADESTAVFCPFQIRHNGGEKDGYDIKKDDLNLMCSEGDTEAPSACTIQGTARHLNVMADQVTLVGFGFKDSNHGAIRVDEATEGLSFVKCSFDHNIRSSGDGGAIELASQSNTLISQSTFLLNSASGGGAICGTLADLSVHGSNFVRNSAMAGTGGAIKMVDESGRRLAEESEARMITEADTGRHLERVDDKSEADVGDDHRSLKQRSKTTAQLTSSRLYVRNSDFTSNSAQIAGPAIFASAMDVDASKSRDGVYSGNNNYGCSNFVFLDSTMCNGYSDGMECSTFKSTCGESSNGSQTRIPEVSDDFDSEPVDTDVDQPVQPGSTPQPIVIPTAWPTVEPTEEDCLGEKCNEGDCCEGFICSRNRRGVCIHAPTPEPSSKPSSSPTLYSSDAPSFSPSTRPSFEPSTEPTAKPTVTPTGNPSAAPSSAPSVAPTAAPTPTPSAKPSGNPSSEPSGRPSSEPSGTPSSEPTGHPSSEPSSAPTEMPTFLPTSVPTFAPTASTKCGIDDTTRYNLIFQTLTSVSDALQLWNLGTPQGKAANWLIFQDAMMLCPGDINVIQRYVMAVFYFSTGGENWLTCSADPSTNDCPGLYIQRFLSDHHECTWAGITCPDQSSSITIIAFENNGLVGFIPSELSALSQLNTLRLEHGQLSGVIPASLGGLSQLEKLDLDFNALIGTIPQALSQATNLQLLDLNNNALVGSIDVLRHFPDLFFAQLHSNQFSGSLPDLGTLTKLRVFSAHDNNLQGEVPFSFCNLRQFEKLDVLQVDCAEPDPKVECICCTKCYPLPPTPSPIDGSSENRVDIETPSPTNAPTQAPTTLPTEFPSNVPTPVPTTSTQAPTTKCRVDHDSRAQQIIDTLSSVSSQSNLLNEGTHQDMALKWILFYDDMALCPDDYNLIQRYVAALFFFSTNGENWLDKGSGNEEFLGSSSECQWKGFTCNDDGDATLIQFEKNGLSGTIPNEISALAKLEVLSLEQGSLTGTIPTTIGNMKALQKLDLDFNELTGVLPPNIWEATSLSVLDLNSNQLSGDIVVLTGFRDSMRFIQLHNNRFSGSIPGGLGLMTNLEVLTLHKTNLEGKMPMFVCNNAKALLGGSLTHLWAECGGPNPKVECSCCTKCFSN